MQHEGFSAHNASFYPANRMPHYTAVLTQIELRRRNGVTSVEYISDLQSGPLVTSFPRRDAE